MRPSEAAMDAPAQGGLTRRDLLKLAGSLPVLATVAPFGGLPEAVLSAASEARHIAGYDPALLPSATTLAGWLKQLHDVGPIRMTGTSQCRAFEEFLARQFAALGFAVERDQFRLTSWACDLEQDCSIEVVEDGGPKKTVEVVSYYPFGGSTRGARPVTGRVLVVPGPGVAAAKALADAISASVLADSIIVMDMPLARGGGTPAGSGNNGLFPERFPAERPARTGGPSPAGQSGREIMEIFEHRCKALVLCYTDVSNDSARYNYLPFSDQHRTLPTLWVGAEGSRYLRGVSGKASLTLRCDATLVPDSRADTILATLPGQSREVVFLTTQTDGPNECNENGALGVLAVATYWSKVPAAKRSRTLVCSLPTGHYAAGAVADPKTGSGRRAGTRGVLEKWPDVASRIVGQISLEQMGAMEWVDTNGTFAPTGNVAGERWIPTPGVSATATRKIFMASTAGENPKYSNAVLVESGGAPGEGGSLRSRGLPGIGLMGQPGYFFRCDPRGVLDKLSPDVMHNQVAFATKMTVLMNRLTVDQLAGKTPLTDADLFGA
jgi:hypothetical protein